MLFLLLLTYKKCGRDCNFFEKLRNGKGRNHLNKVLVIFYIVFVATELHPDTIFFQNFPAYQQNEN